MPLFYAMAGRVAGAGRFPYIPAMPSSHNAWRLPGLVLVLLLVTGHAAAHPEDEFCVPGEGGLDPALCEALSQLDSTRPGDARTGPLTTPDGLERGAFSTAILYVSIGIRHILPGGLDHILFVLALFLAARRNRDLVLQISAFTVAHTATLALAAVGVVAPPAGIVEPLIAGTIAFVAVENIGFAELTRWRVGIVFLFGLVHGLGFAGFFGELGLPAGQFWSALIGFNVGVEIGQLAVVAAAYLAVAGLRQWLPSWTTVVAYRRRIVIPLSAAIALTGAIWTVERVLSAAA